MWGLGNVVCSRHPELRLSFFCAEFLKDEQFFDARQVIISSASSKTALGLAFLLAQGRPEGIRIVALTSAANAGFVGKRGVYDRVLSYEAISSMPAVFMDIAGDGAVRAAVHRHLGDDLKHSARVGFTHWDALAPVETGLPGPAPRLFFAPDHILERRQECGAELLAARLLEAWRGFLGYVKPARHRAYDRQGRRGANVPAGARRSHAARAGVCRVDRLAVMTLLKRRAT